MVRALTGASAAAMAALLAMAPGGASAQDLDPRPSVNLYGQPGLIDMPSAEMMPEGEVTLGWNWFEGTTRRNLTFQVLPRVAATVRFATLANWGAPGDPGFDLNDRSFDLTFQIVDEAGWRPAIAVGLRDIFGTGVYSSEYLVASKRVVPSVTVSAGIGWGRLAGGSSFGNPFCEVIGGGFCDRAEGFDGGGGLAVDRFFQGSRASPFAGIEWRTPLDGLTLKAEYSPDDYAREQAGPRADFERRERFNLGAEYRLTRGITLGGYWLYGSTFGLNVVVTANPRRPVVPQDYAPGPLPVTARAADAPTGRGWAANEAAQGELGAALAEALAAEGVRLEELRVTPEVAEVRVVNRRLAQDPRAIGRIVRVLQTGMPASVETFRVTMLRDGLAVTTVTIDRSTYEGLIEQPLAGERMWEAAVVESAVPGPDPEAGAWRPEGGPRFGFSVLPAPWFVFTGRDDPLRGGVSADALASVEFGSGFSVSGRVSQPLLGPSDPAPVDTALQPVRTALARYHAGSTPDLVRLTADWVGKAAPDVYLRGSVGYFERVFGGVSGEVLWKPSESPFGVGLELNYVAQRDTDGGFGFGEFDYQVATGHASLYWDTGFRGVELQLDAGRYLAGDWGATLRASRRFANGWAIGAFATLTEVSSGEFGEGAFDKGVTLEIPLKWAVPLETRTRPSFELRTVTRDGGARLRVANRLYGTVRELDRPRLERNWGAFWQ